MKTRELVVNHFSDMRIDGRFFYVGDTTVSDPSWMIRNRLRALGIEEKDVPSIAKDVMDFLKYGEDYPT